MRTKEAPDLGSVHRAQVICCHSNIRTHHRQEGMPAVATFCGILQSWELRVHTWKLDVAASDLLGTPTRRCSAIALIASRQLTHTHGSAKPPRPVAYRGVCAQPHSGTGLTWTHSEEACNSANQERHRMIGLSGSHPLQFLALGVGWGHNVWG